MAVIVSQDALEEVLTTFFSEELYVGDVSLDEISDDVVEQCRAGGPFPSAPEHGLFTVFRAMERSGDEAFVRLAIEQLIADGTDDDFGNLLNDFGGDWEAAVPVLRTLYGWIWGDLPEGPPPIIEYFRVSIYRGLSERMARWHREREARYGQPPFDYEMLRRVSLAPLRPSFPVRGRGWVAVPDGDAYLLSFDPGAHVPQEVTVRASVADVRALRNRTPFNDVVGPLMRAQGVKVI